MEFRGTSSDCSKVIKCVGYINGFCPTELRHSGGCYHPCTVFNNKQFCCLGTTDECPPTTAYFKFFKGCAQTPTLLPMMTKQPYLLALPALTISYTVWAAAMPGGGRELKPEYAFRAVNNMDFFDISLLDGFNVPMEFRGTSIECTKVIKCVGDINGLCPTELRHSGGCYHQQSRLH
ncbi:hypothetical protein Q3G72_028320 [Acer saccharum]|nr:hypothetical protein Q3G72_028320 [Acer saccharum]